MRVFLVGFPDLEDGTPSDIDNEKMVAVLRTGLAAEVKDGDSVGFRLVEKLADEVAEPA